MKEVMTMTSSDPFPTAVGAFRHGPNGWEPDGWDPTTSAAYAALAGNTPLDVSKAITHLNRLEELGAPIELLEAATRYPVPEDPKDTYREGQRSNDPAVLAALAMAGDDRTRAQVATNKHSPDWLIAHLAADPVQRVRRGAASHARLPAALIPVLAADRSWEVRGRVAGRKDVPVEVLVALSADKDERIVTRAVGNRLFPPSELAQVTERCLEQEHRQKGPSPALARIVGRGDVPVEVLKRIGEERTELAAKARMKLAKRARRTGGAARPSSKSGARRSSSPITSGLVVSPLEFAIAEHLVDFVVEHCTSPSTTWSDVEEARVPVVPERFFSLVADHDAQRAYFSAVGRDQEVPEVHTTRFRWLAWSIGRQLVVERAVRRLVNVGLLGVMGADRELVVMFLDRDRFVAVCELTGRPVPNLP